MPRSFTAERKSPESCQKTCRPIVESDSEKETRAGIAGTRPRFKRSPLRMRQVHFRPSLLRAQPGEWIRGVYKSMMLLISLAAGLSLLAAPDGDGYTTISYPPSTEPGGLQVGVTYTFWIPGGVGTLKGLIVHQHGCGSGACKGGATAATDLHWQALARKWDCALLGPSYQQEDKQDCSLWCDPRKGSEK